MSFKYNVFISYCHKDKEEVNKLVNELKNKGFKFWIDQNEMTSGNIDKLIQRGIDQSELFMCCATSSYCKSEICLLEVNYAIYKKKTIIYILFEKFKGNEERLEKLDEIAFRFAGQKYYKHDDVSGIMFALKAALTNPELVESSSEFYEFKNNLPKIMGEDVIKPITFSDARLLNRISLFNNGKNLLMTDCQKNLLISCDLNGQKENVISLDKNLVCPRGLFVSSKEEIYILDYLSGSIFIFNNEFQLIKRIGENLIRPSYLSVDLESQLIYISHLLSDEIIVSDITYGKLIGKINVKRPLHSKIYQDKLFVISMVNCDVDRKKVLEIKSGNFISVINRKKLEIIQTLRFKDWFDPWSLHLTSDFNLYTIAKEIDKEGFISENYFLFKVHSNSFSSNFNIKEKIKLENISSFNDALYLENKIILCGVGNNEFSNQIKIIQFN